MSDLLQLWAVGFFGVALAAYPWVLCCCGSKECGCCPDRILPDTIIGTISSVGPWDGEEVTLTRDPLPPPGFPNGCSWYGEFDLSCTDEGPPIPVRITCQGDSADSWTSGVFEEFTGPGGTNTNGTYAFSTCDPFMVFIEFGGYEECNDFWPFNITFTEPPP